MKNLKEKFVSKKKIIKTGKSQKEWKTGKEKNEEKMKTWKRDNFEKLNKSKKEMME